MDEAVVEAAAGAVVPEDSVAVAGEEQRDGDVGIVLREVDGFTAVVPDTTLVLAETIKSFLRIPHIDEALGVVRFFAVDYGRSKRASIFLGEFVAGGVIENDGAVGAGDFDFQLGRG